MFILRWRWVRLIGLLILLFTFSLAPSASIAAAGLVNGPLDEPLNVNTTISKSSPGQTEQPISLATPPQKAYDLLKQLQERGGIPLPGYIGGRDFQNRERHLPRGYYREYDVNPKRRGRGRDAERLVIEQRSGKPTIPETTTVPLSLLTNVQTGE